MSHKRQSEPASDDAAYAGAPAGGNSVSSGAETGTETMDARETGASGHEVLGTCFDRRARPGGFDPGMQTDREFMPDDPSGQSDF